MPSVDDPQRFGDRLKKERRRLEEAAIPEADRDAITRFMHARSGSLETSSLLVYINHLRRASEKAETPLVDMDRDDVSAFIFDLQHNEEYGRGGGGYAASTVKTYRDILVVFFGWLDRDFHEDIDRIKVEDQTVTPDTVLSPGDIQDLIEAARYQRDVALIDFLADTGARLSLVASLRVGDVELDEETGIATYTPNPNARGLKGATTQPYPIIDAKASLRNYLRSTHPRPTEPEAALFHKLQNFANDIDEDDGAMSPSRFRTIVNDIGADAGLDKPTNPHAFRHAAITRMLREGYTRSEIEHRVHWTLDTDMWQVYSHIAGEEHNTDIFRRAGIVEDEQGPDRERHPCGNCGEPLARHHQYCPRCAEPATRKTREQFREGQTDVAKSQADVRSLSRRDLRARLIAEMNRNDGHDSTSSSQSNNS